MTFKQIIKNALAEVKKPKALKAKACIVEPIKGDFYTENEYHFGLPLCVNGQLLFEYDIAFEKIKICAITNNTEFEETIHCKNLTSIDKKTKDYLRVSIENALKHLYFVNEKEIEKDLNY